MPFFYFLFLLTGTQFLTCPARQTATQARHWVAAVGVDAVASFSAVQPVRPLLRAQICKTRAESWTRQHVGATRQIS